MRLCTLLDAGRRRAGLVDGDRVTPLDASGPMEILLGAQAGPSGDPLPLDPGRLREPLRPGKLIGIGLNYRDHAAETGAKVPAEPLLFAKLPSAVAPPSGPVVVPAYTEELDFEGELAVVIGRAARDVPEGRALEHVFGYAVMNDVSARDRQRAEPQWVRAKGGDTFAPWGPWITTADEAGDPHDLALRTWVNGELRQDGTTADLIFDVPRIVGFLRETCTLEPGDLILTGTPAGVGMAMDPRRFLEPGDVVRIEIDRLGSIEHAIA